MENNLKARSFNPLDSAIGITIYVLFPAAFWAAVYLGVQKFAQFVVR